MNEESDLHGEEKRTSFQRGIVASLSFNPAINLTPLYLDFSVSNNQQARGLNVSIGGTRAEWAWAQQKVEIQDEKAVRYRQLTDSR